MMLPRRSSHDTPRPLRWLVGTSISLVAIASLPLSTFWQKGYAQSFTDEEIGNYAKAVLGMENIRKNAYAEISDLMRSQQLDVTRYSLSCPRAKTVDLPRSVRRPVRILLINYCNNAKKLVEDTGLTVTLFNSITATHEKDEALAEQIQLEIARLR